jgi:hydrogenase maturation protease
MEMNKEILVVGIGNTDRGDDGAGIVTARCLREKLSPEIPVVELSGSGAELLDLWQTTNATTVYIIDAMSSERPPGTIQCFEAHIARLPVRFAGDYSTHSFGLTYAIEMAAALACLPGQIFVYGIEGKCFDSGDGLSKEVETAVRKVAKEIASRLLHKRY